MIRLNNGISNETPIQNKCSTFGIGHGSNGSTTASLQKDLKTDMKISHFTENWEFLSQLFRYFELI